MMLETSLQDARLLRRSLALPRGITRMKEGGSVTVFRPHGGEPSFSPVFGNGIAGPWAVSVDGNDNIWISNVTTAAAGIVELCGFRTENCPPGSWRV